ncbi:hotdog fold domain-containing protein [Desulforamulus ruminis]
MKPSRRVIMIDEPETWGVTVELSVKYNLPVPLEQPLTAIGRITRNNRRFFEGTGEIYLPDGSLAVSAAGKYLKLPIDRIADFDKQSKSGKWYIIKMTLWKSICLIKRKMNQRNPKTPSPLFIMEST